MLYAVDAATIADVTTAGTDPRAALAGARRALVDGRLLVDVALAVMEAATAAEAIAWVRAFAMGQLLDGATPDVGRAWEAEMTHELASRQEADGMIRLGGVTRIVVARAG